MTDVTIALRGAAADKLRKLVAEDNYADPEAAVADALEALDANRDAALDAWLREVVAERLDDADPAQALTGDQVRSLLRT